MQPAATPPPLPPDRAPRAGTAKRILAVLVLLALAFAAGYVPQRLRADRLEDSMRGMQLDLELANAHRDLGLAALEAQRSNFANAATAASAFFDACARLAQDQRLAAQPRTRIALGAYAGTRDQLSVQLAQADPQAAQKLAALYFTMQGVMARKQ